MASGIISNNILRIKYLAIPYTISANGMVSLKLQQIIDADLPKGHKYIGISGFSTNNFSVIPFSIRYQSIDYGLELRNLSNGNVSNTFSFYYLYI